MDLIYEAEDVGMLLVGVLGLVCLVIGLWGVVGFGRHL